MSETINCDRVCYIVQEPTDFKKIAKSKIVKRELIKKNRNYQKKIESKL